MSIFFNCHISGLYQNKKEINIQFDSLLLCTVLLLRKTNDLGACVVLFHYTSGGSSVHYTSEPFAVNDTFISLPLVGLYPQLAPM